MKKLRFLFIALSIAVCGINHADALTVALAARCDYPDGSTTSLKAYYQNTYAIDPATSLDPLCQDSSKSLSCADTQSNNLAANVVNTRLGKSTYTSCTRLKVYNLSGTQYTGNGAYVEGEINRPPVYYIVCFDQDDSYSECKRFRDTTIAACNADYKGTLHSGILLNTAFTTLNTVYSAGTPKEYEVRLNQWNCCKTCSGYADWQSENDACEYTTANTCSIDGVCSAGSSNKTGRCKAGYYSASGMTSVSVTGTRPWCTGTNEYNLNCQQCHSAMNCPAGSTLDNLKCAEGYFLSDTDCVECTESTVGEGAYCPEGTGIGNYQCIEGYYKDSSGCVKCPQPFNDSPSVSENLLQSPRSSTSVDSCYIAASATEYTDDTGTFKVVEDCQYTGLQQ